MTDDEKRELAKMLAPHLAWDLSRSEMFSYEPNDTVSGAACQILIDQVVIRMRRKMYDAEAFTVAIIPRAR